MSNPCESSAPSLYGRKIQVHNGYYNFRKAWLVLVLGTAATMTDLADLDYVMDCNPPRVTISGSRSGQLDPFSFPATESEYRRSKVYFHGLTNRVEPGLEFAPSSTPLDGQRRLIEGSITELVRRTT
uniref:Uncharacterized protein n=1 Tax=Schistocephalus solidus TaxID=70667 RepID=A0A0X3PEN9_SCHSO